MFFIMVAYVMFLDVSCLHTKEMSMKRALIALTVVFCAVLRDSVRTSAKSCGGPFFCNLEVESCEIHL